MKELNPHWDPHEMYNSPLANRITKKFYDILRRGLTGQENGVYFFPDVYVIEVDLV